MTILGIDPSQSQTGWAVIAANTGSLEVVGAGSIPFKLSKGKQKNAKEVEMLSIIYDYVFEITSRFSVTSYSVELPPPLCRRGAQKLQQVVGAIKAALGANNVTTGDEYYPCTVKLTVGGHGLAEKAQVSEGVSKLLTYPWEFRNYDESDAAAVALTYAIKTAEADTKADLKNPRKHPRKHPRKQNGSTLGTN